MKTRFLKMAMDNAEDFTPLNCMGRIAPPRQNKQWYDGLFNLKTLTNLLFLMEGKEDYKAANRPTNH